MRKLRFVNQDAAEKVIELEVSDASVAPIMAWYGGFYAGDNYQVFLDGIELQKDHNGELVGAVNGTR